MDEIDFNRLRSDLINYYEGAYFVGGFGAALMDAEDVKRASNEELIKIAIKNGFKLEKYVKRGFSK